MTHPTYPKPDLVYELSEIAARSQVANSNSTHPEDVSVQVSMAADTVGAVLAYLHFEGYLSEKAYK